MQIGRSEQNHIRRDHHPQIYTASQIHLPWEGGYGGAESPSQSEFISFINPNYQLFPAVVFLSANKGYH